MKLESSGRSRERILVYGTFGVGKTRGWFDIADSTPDDVTFYVVDTDGTVIDYFDEGREHLEDRIVYEEVYDFPEAKAALKKFSKQAKRGDWIVVDRIDPMWDWSQNYFSEYVFEQGAGDVGLEWRRDVVQGDEGGKNPFDGTMDWPYIKKLYYEHIQTPAVVRNRAHVYLTAGEKKLIDHFEDESTMRRYGGEGYKPAGEKTLGHAPKTVLRLKGMDPWRMSTIKDRERTVNKGVQVNNFARDYLLKVAGWRPVKDEDQAA